MSDLRPALWDGLEGICCVVVAPPRVGGKVSSRGWTDHHVAWPSESHKLPELIEAFAATRDVYVIPCLHAEGGRKIETPAVGSRWLWVDDDGDELDELLVRLGAMVVCSGRKRHAYVALDDTNDTDMVVDFNTRLKDALAGGDHKQQHNSLLRLPGSLNHKTDPPLPVKITTPASKTWSVEQLDELLPKRAPHKKSPGGHRRRSQSVHSPVYTMVDALPAELLRIVRIDTAVEVGRRSSRAWAMCGDLIRAGFSDDEIYTALLTEHRPTLHRIDDKGHEWVAGDIATIIDKRRSEPPGGACGLCVHAPGQEVCTHEPSISVHANPEQWRLEAERRVPKPSYRQVVVVIAEHAAVQPDRGLWLGKGWLAAHAMVSERTAAYARAWLCGHGLLVRERRGGMGRGDTSRFRLTIPEEDE